jgi:hypothetical protein
MNVSVATSPLFLSRVLTMVTSCPPVAVILLVPLRILRRHCSVSSRMPVCRAYFVFDFSSSSPVGCRRGRARAPPPPAVYVWRVLADLHAPRATSLWHSAISRCSRADPLAPNAPQP